MQQLCLCYLKKDFSTMYSALNLLLDKQNLNSSWLSSIKLVSQMLKYFLQQLLGSLQFSLFEAKIRNKKISVETWFHWCHLSLTFSCL